MLMLCHAELWHAFFMVEARMKGTIEEAANYCVRGGATLVHAVLVLSYLPGADITVEGAETETAMFSFAVTLWMVALHVYWAEVRKGQTLCHIYHLYSCAMKNKDSGSKLRHGLDSILDWGILTRQAKIFESLHTIATAQMNRSLPLLPTPPSTTEDIEENDVDLG